MFKSWVAVLMYCLYWFKFFDLYEMVFIYIDLYEMNSGCVYIYIYEFIAMYSLYRWKQVFDCLDLNMYV